MRRFLPDVSARLTPGQARMLRALEFLVRVTILSLPLYMVIWLGIDLHVLQSAASGQAAWILQVLGFSLTHQGTSISLENGFRFFIIPDCTGWKSMLFLFALIFAVPLVSLRKRLAGLAVGLPLIWIGNLLRIVSVVSLQGIWGTEAALFMHDTVFQAGLIAAVLITWLAWLLWAKDSLKLPGRAWKRLNSFRSRL